MSIEDFKIKTYYYYKFFFFVRGIIILTVAIKCKEPNRIREIEKTKADFFHKIMHCISH